MIKYMLKNVHFAIVKIGEIMNKIGATVVVVEQVGMDRWQDNYHTKIFDESTEIKYVLEWARRFLRNADINDVIFSKIEED